MQIKDANGKVIANVDLSEGFSIKDLVKSVSGKRFNKSLEDLLSVDESIDKKQIVFKFSNGSIFYDLPKKVFVRENGVKIGENSFRSIKLNLDNKLVKHHWWERDTFWLEISDKSNTPWIKTFFKIVDIWANKKYNGGHGLGAKERMYRNKIQRLADNSKFFDCVESFSKISQFQSLEETELVSFYTKMLEISKEVTKKSGQPINRSDDDCIVVNAGKGKLDGWYFANLSRRVSNNYEDNNEEGKTLAAFAADYIKCCDNGIKDLFQYTFDTYRGVIRYKQIEKIKSLIKFGYEPKRLINYLYQDIFNQGLDLGTNNWGYDLGALQTLFDYARMNRELKRDYEKYPRYLQTLHDITHKNYALEEDKIIREKFKEVVNNLCKSELNFSDNYYCIVFPKSGKDLISEGQNLSHCVASYYNRMANGETVIVFLRKKKEIHQSLVTIEISSRGIVQAKGKNNSNPQKPEMDFIEKYQKHLKEANELATQTK